MKQSKNIFSAYYELTKPSISYLVLVTTFLGYYLGGQGIQSYSKLTYLLIGAYLVCAGSAVLNHYIERDIDTKMNRTKNRPIPSGQISAANALSFGIVMILMGLIILYAKINQLTAFLSMLTSFLYILVYTPLKKVSWLNTTIGSIPGAIPPLGGWAAATGSLDFGAGIIFAILFLWQHPHFYAIAWMFKDDYARAGFKMLPVVEPNGESMFNQILWFSSILIPISLLPTMIGLSGYIYFVGALISGIILFLIGLKFKRSHSMNDARTLLRATVLYLPILVILIMIDVNF